MGEILRVHTCGVHREEIAGTEVFTYVEPDMSINTNRIQNTHEFAGNMVARPYFAEANVCTKGDQEADEALYNLLGMNQTIEVGLLVGWFTACHLKTHIMSIHNQFPVLSVWGSAGSGKSVTVSLFSWLTGTDYTMRDSPVNVSNITPFAILEYASSSTTVPRVMEEYNKSKMRASHWKSVGEILKATWNGESVLRGGLADKGTTSRTGGKVNKIPITGPLVAVSEQELDMPALQERSIRVKLSKDKRKGKRKELREANRGRKKLREVGKALMAKALQTTTDKVDEIMEDTEDYLSEDIDDRPRYCYQICLVGLKFLLETVEDNLRLKKSTERLKEIIADIEEHYHLLGENVQDINAHTEIDMVMEEMHIMAVMQKGGDYWLKKGIHYVTNEQFLWIDPLVAHAEYKMYVKNGGSQPVVTSTRSFTDLLGDEHYCIGKDVVTGMASGRPMLKLDRNKMREKGLDTSNFD